MPPFRLDERPHGGRTAPPVPRPQPPTAVPLASALASLASPGSRNPSRWQLVRRLREGLHVVLVGRVQGRQAGSVEGGRVPEQRAEAGAAAGLARQRGDGGLELREADAAAGVAVLVSLDRRRRPLGDRHGRRLGRRGAAAGPAGDVVDGRVDDVALRRRVDPLRASERRGRHHLFLRDARQRVQPVLVEVRGARDLPQAVARRCRAGGREGGAGRPSPIRARAPAPSCRCGSASGSGSHSVHHR